MEMFLGPGFTEGFFLEEVQSRVGISVELESARGFSRGEKGQIGVFQPDAGRSLVPYFGDVIFHGVKMRNQLCQEVVEEAVGFSLQSREGREFRTKGFPVRG